mmetsp:Transcript_20078/g.29794  ORF Transcript_20078/g.29794 Transcript_20078/m.29794 type:complete len:319 (-) Transcript_20078:348-1304(-)
MPRYLLIQLMHLAQCFVIVHSYSLITFDVDGTLVRGFGKAAESSAHAKAFSHAVGKVLGDGHPTKAVADALDGREYHGSTDGLILLRLARATLGIEPSESYPKLEDLMFEMYQYIQELPDEEIAKGIEPLPGVLDHLETLSNMKDRVACGLVTGNVEGIARRKMRAVGVLNSSALAPPSQDQIDDKRWLCTQEISFLGGFGSDYCSGIIDDFSRNHLDRAEQIAIATKRCKDSLDGDKLKRIVHVGDAPADVLAAKEFSQTMKNEADLCVGMVAVATGKYTAEELRQLAGEPELGSWEPVILEQGMADPNFLRSCGVI